MQQRSLRQQLHAVGRLRVARGKAEVRHDRKMGHITFVGMTAGEYERRWAARFV